MGEGIGVSWWSWACGAAGSSWVVALHRLHDGLCGELLKNYLPRTLFRALDVTELMDIRIFQSLLLLMLLSVTQLGVTLCDPMDYSLPCSPVRWIFQARILDWIAISFSRGSSWPRDQTQVCYIAGGFFTTEPPAAAIAMDTRQQLSILHSFLLLGRSILWSFIFLK